MELIFSFFTLEGVFEDPIPGLDGVELRAECPGLQFEEDDVDPVLVLRTSLRELSMEPGLPIGEDSGLRQSAPKLPGGDDTLEEPGLEKSYPGTVLSLFRGVMGGVEVSIGTGLRMGLLKRRGGSCFVESAAGLFFGGVLSPNNEAY